MRVEAGSSAPSVDLAELAADHGELRLVDDAGCLPSAALPVALELDLDGEGQAVVGLQRTLEEDFAVGLLRGPVAAFGLPLVVSSTLDMPTHCCM